MGGVEAGVGHSGDSDARTAGAQAASRAVADLDGAAEIVYVFASSEYDGDGLLEGVGEATDASVVGCTSAGEIANTGSYTQTVSTFALGGDGIDASVGVADYEDGDYEAGRRAAERALDEHGGDRIATETVARTGDGWQSYPATAGTMYCDYVIRNTELMDGVTDAVGNMTVTGGGAADDWKFDGSGRVFHGRDVLSDAAVFTALDLDVRTGVGRKHGYGIERELTVTAVEGDRVLEFDGRPALDVYHDLYGAKADSAQFRITVPIGIDAGGDEERILTPGEIDEEERSISYTGGELLSEGTTCYVMDPDGDSVMAGAEEAVQQALSRAGDPDDVAGVLVDDCMCRWYFLSDTESREQELDVIRDYVGDDVPIAGLYTSGEIAWPGMARGTYDQTIVVWVISNEPL